MLRKDRLSTKTNSKNNFLLKYLKFDDNKLPSIK